MFRGQTLVKPKSRSLLLTLVVAAVAFSGAQLSPLIGYGLALLTLVIIALAVSMDSIWPTRAKAEHVLVFPLFWGLLVGVLLPFLLGIFLEDGFSGIYKLLTD